MCDSWYGPGGMGCIRAIPQSERYVRRHFVGSNVVNLSSSLEGPLLSLAGQLESAPRCGRSRKDLFPPLELQTRIPNSPRRPLNLVHLKDIKVMPRHLNHRP